MKVYSIGVYEKAMPLELSWKEKLVAAKEANFDFVEISIDETDEKLARLKMSKMERKELVDLMYEVGIPIHTMCLSGHRKYPLGSNQKEIEQRSLEIMKDAIELAADLGIRIIQLAGYDVYYEESSSETKSRFFQNLQKAVEMAAKEGVHLSFETMETEFMNTVEKAMLYVSKINSSYLNIYPDIGNITNACLQYKTNVVSDLKLGAGHFDAIHLKETKPNMFREIPFGEGHVDFQEAVDVVWSLGIRKFVTEFWYVGSLSWKEDLLDVNKKMRSILDRKE